jgi:hypothetical protein
MLMIHNRYENYLKTITMAIRFFSLGDSLATSPFPRLLSIRKFLSVNLGRHAQRRHRLCRILVGKNDIQYQYHQSVKTTLNNIYHLARKISINNLYLDKIHIF